MSSAVIKETKGSVIINRIRSICEDNANDELLESLRLQSLNFSHDYENRSLKRLFVPSNGLRNGEDTKKFFSPRKRFHDHVNSTNSSTSIESLNLEAGQFVHDSNSSRKSASDHSSHQFFGGSDDGMLDYVKHGTNTSCNPIHRILNFSYKQLSSIKTQESSDGNTKKKKNESDDESNTHDDLTTSRSFISAKHSFSPPSYQNIMLLDDVGYTESDYEEYCVPISNRKNSKRNIIKHYTPPENLLSNGLRSSTDGSFSADDDVYTSAIYGGNDYSFVSNNPSCVFNLSFEKSFSRIDTSISSVIPKKLVVNKSPFLIGCDNSCDLVINKCKYIQRKHCELIFEEVGDGNSERYNVFRYRITIVKRDSDAVVYINNAVLHDSATLKDGDLLSLGPKDNHIGFRVIFRPLDDHLPSTKLHPSFSLNKKHRLHPQAASVHNTLGSDSITEKRSVQVLIFEVLCNNISFLGPCSRNTSLSDQSDISITDAKDISYENRISFSEIDMSDERITCTAMGDTGLYRLQSPNRQDRDTPVKNSHTPWDLSPSASPSSFERMSTLKLDSISPGSDMLLNAYGNIQNDLSSWKNPTSDETNEKNQALKPNTEKLNRDKILLLRSLNSEEFPIIVDSETSYTTGNRTPKAEGASTMNCIGMINVSNNMLICEILPDIERLLRRYHGMEEDSEEYRINLYDIIIKHYSNPVDEDSLNKSWIFQLDHIDWNNPHLKRAMCKNDLIFDSVKDKISGRPVSSMETNKYRVMYIRRKDFDNFKL